MENQVNKESYLNAIWTIVKTKIEEHQRSYAELNQEFIVATFRKLSKGQTSLFPQFSFKNDVNNDRYNAIEDIRDLPPFPGLYLISEVRPPNDKCPIYVGYTSQEVPTRLTGHEAIKDYYKVPRGANRYLVFSSVPTCNASHGKLLESVFLAAFDFCYNLHENGPVRQLPDIKPPETQNSLDRSQKVFNNAYARIFKEISNLCVYNHSYN